MFGTETRKIGDRHFEVRALPAKMGRKALLRLTKKLGPAVAAMLDGRDATGLEGVNLMDLDVSGAIRTLAQDLEEGDMEYFCDLFAAYTAAEVSPGTGQMMELGKGTTFDMLFSQHYEVMLQWLWFCLEVNFGGFFGALGVSASPLAAAKAAKG